MSQTILEINGRHIDVTTGGLITSQQKPPQPTNIDGFTRNPNTEPTKLTPQPIKPTIPTRSGRLMHDVTVSKRHKLQKSKTLMRSSVKKPNHSPQSSHHHSVNSLTTIANQSYLAALTSDTRLDRALHTPMHPTVSRFDNSVNHKVKPTLQHMPVVATKEPISQMPQVTLNHQSSSIRQPHVRTSNDFVNNQLLKASDTSVESPFKKEKLHKRVKNRFSSNKLVSISAVVASVAMISGFIVYQNLPTISLALASHDAGISMSVPKGIPSNFEMDKKVDASPGQITISYRSRIDNREFAITQLRETEGTQESLEKAIASSTQGEYQTYQTNGIKLFMAAPGRADWIDGKMRYSVSGNSGLSSEQLATIAASL